MKCQHRSCPFDTDGVIDAKSTVREKLDMMSFHVQAEHTPEPAQPAPIAQAASGGKKPEKFPRPSVGVDETSEKWEDFQASWAQYKDEYSLQGQGLTRQLVACCSGELATSLSRVTGGKHFTLDETTLLLRMKELAVQYQNPAVYVQEFLAMAQQPDEGVRHYLSRLKGVATHCNFSTSCTCNETVSYANHLTRFKLVAGLVDEEIKEDVLGGEEKTIKETV